MSAFRTHGRGHLNGPVVVIGTGSWAPASGSGSGAAACPCSSPIPSPTNQAVAVDIGAGLPLARLGDEQPELVVVAAPPDVTADVVERSLAGLPGRPSSWTSPASRPASWPTCAAAARTLPATWAPIRWPGREKSGPVAARGELFTSMPWVVCPSEETSPGALQAAARPGDGPWRRRLRVRRRGTRRGRGARVAPSAGHVLARGQPAAGHAPACPVPCRQRPAGRHPDRRQRSHPLGPDPWRQRGQGRRTSCTGSARTSTG